ncbi:hypothetical protein Tco_0624220 [Tanacetum coccineum]|uniref:Uncharacterized protein n=1 Tax=Tanacetum coccineum TaxID=301880 RepID=A0ABQ4WDE1_9ASTR
MALGYQNPFYLKQARQKQQSLYNGKVLLEKHDPPAVYDSEETLQLAQERVFVSQKAKSREELYFSNTSKTATDSKSISIPNEEFLDDTSPNVARKFINELKSTIVTLQRVVKQKMTLDIHNWSSTDHQELHKIIKDEIFPIINQVDARLQNFKRQFLKEADKFVRDFKSLAKKANESLAKHKTLEFEIERLLRAVVSPDIMSIVQTYNDIQQKIERLQAQLGDQKGKSKDTSYVSDTLDSLSQKLENENVKLEFQYVNGMKSRQKKQRANVSKSENQKKHKANVKKSKKFGSEDRLASSRQNKPRTCHKWLPTGRIFNLSGAITKSSNTEMIIDFGIELVP